MHRETYDSQLGETFFEWLSISISIFPTTTKSRNLQSLGSTPIMISHFFSWLTQRETKPQMCCLAQRLLIGCTTLGRAASKANTGQTRIWAWWDIRAHMPDRWKTRKIINLYIQMLKPLNKHVYGFLTCHFTHYTTNSHIVHVKRWGLDIYLAAGVVSYPYSSMVVKVFIQKRSYKWSSLIKTKYCVTAQ